MVHHKHFNHPSMKTVIAACIAASFASGAYAAPGDLIGSPVAIGASSLDYIHSGVRIASDANGNQVASWVDYPSRNILVQRFSANGAPIGNAIQIAAAKPPDQGEVTNPVVAVNAAGQFVVAWTDVAPIINLGPQILTYFAWPTTLHARTFQADGTPVSGDIQFANMPLSSIARNSAAVAIDDDGDFVASWWKSSQSIVINTPTPFPYPVAYGESQAVYARVYSAAGKAKTGRIKIDSGYATFNRLRGSATGHLDGPVAVGMDGAGDFTVAWQITDAAGTFASLNIRSYTPKGVARGKAQVINQTPPKIYTFGGPAIAMNRSGQYVVTWFGCSQTNSDGYTAQSVCARSFQPGDTPASDEFAVNSDLPLPNFGFSYADTWAPAAIDASGNFVIATCAESGSQKLVRLFSPDGSSRSASIALPQSEEACLFEAGMGMSMDSQGDAEAIYIGPTTADTAGTLLNPVLLQPISGN